MASILLGLGRRKISRSQLGRAAVVQQKWSSIWTCFCRHIDSFQMFSILKNYVENLNINPNSKTVWWFQKIGYVEPYKGWLYHISNHTISTLFLSLLVSLQEPTIFGRKQILAQQNQSIEKMIVGLLVKLLFFMVFPYECRIKPLCFLPPETNPFWLSDSEAICRWIVHLLHPTRRRARQLMPGDS